jgi:hypothetical protein
MNPTTKPIEPYTVSKRQTDPQVVIFDRTDGARLELAIGDQYFWRSRGPQNLSVVTADRIKAADPGTIFLVLTEYNPMGQQMKQVLLDMATRYGDMKHELDKLQAAFTTAFLFLEEIRL